MQFPKNELTSNYGKNLVAAIFAFSAIGGASAATLAVGPGKTYAAPCAAFAAAKDGDTIEIQGGTTYRGDVCYLIRHNLTIKGINGRPKIDAAGKYAAGKGTWVISGSNVVIDNVEMYGARVPDRNGAAIRFEGTNLTMRNSFLHDNENGILSGPNTNSDFLIEYSEFAHNGYGDGQSHNLYIGHVKSLTFRYNFSHDANIGHNLKSRANTNTIVYNRFSSLNAGETGSTAAGQPSYEINLPNAGTAYIIGNIIQQPASNSNGTMVAFGEEGASNPTQDLYVVNNTFLNDVGNGGTFLFISGHVSTPALIQNNIFSGIGNVSTQAASIKKSNYLSVAPSFINRAGFDLHPVGSASIIGAATDPGKSASGVSLAPVAQYKATASGEARPTDANLDIGAYEATTSADPMPTTWTNCGSEGSVCAFTGTRQVRFGANGSYAYKTVTGSTPCKTAVFGDPAAGVVKACSYAGTADAPAGGTATPDTVTWASCAKENAVCSFTGTRDVRFGANGLYVTRTVTGSIVCSNANFGDPAPNVVKTCSIASTTATTTPSTPAPAPAPAPVTWTSCSKENATCSFTGTREVRYGANNVFVTKVFTGRAVCSNAVFGDPLKNVVKSCSYSSATR